MAKDVSSFESVESVQEKIIQQDCARFHHWPSIQDLKKEIEQDKNIQLIWATWHGTSEGKKVAWQFFLRPPAFAIVDSLFFILDENDVPLKQDKIPPPFTDPLQQTIYERIAVMSESFPESHWQFALSYSNEKSPVASMIWEENEGFTTCEINR